jgi:hypothetical protein
VTVFLVAAPGAFVLHFAVPWYPKAILIVAAALIAALSAIRPLRNWALRIDIHWLIGMHLIRFVGFYFLYLYARHQLPFGFAVGGGIGDILVATLAGVLLFFSGSKSAVITWNILGLADILGVAITAARSEIAVPGSMHQLDQFPLIFLPTVAVPVIIVSHGLMLLRSFRSHPRTQ